MDIQHLEFERAVLFSFNLDELKKYTRSPSTTDYEFEGFPVAKFNKYLILPKTDYNSYYKLRFNKGNEVTFNKLNNKFYVSTLEGIPPEDMNGLGYYLEPDFSNPQVLIGDSYQIARDSLVVNRKLKPPLTNTKEFSDMLLAQFKILNPENVNQSKFIELPICFCVSKLNILLS